MKSGDLKFSYNITELNEKGMTIQLIFPERKKITSNDIIRINLEKITKFSKLKENSITLEISLAPLVVPSPIVQRNKGKNVGQAAPAVALFASVVATTIM
jgi:hypothetical protein